MLIRIVVTTTDQDVAVHAATVLGVVVHGPYNKNGPRGKKPVWTVSVDKQHEAAGWMMTLYPWMGRRRQAKIWECLSEWKRRG